MYHIRSEQTKAFLKCLRKAAQTGRISKKYLLKYFQIKVRNAFDFIKEEMSDAYQVARSLSATAVVLVIVGLATTLLGLNLCVMRGQMDALETEKTQITEELTQTRTELEKDIEDLTGALASNRQESAEKDEIIEKQQNELADSAAEKEELVKNFTEQIDSLDLLSGAASRSAADLASVHGSFSELEMLIRDALGYTETADGLIARLDAKETALQDVADRYPDFYPTIGGVNSPFGYRRHPVTGATKLHKGVDLGTGTGTPIWAAAKGTVSFIGYDSGYGNHICVDHGNGYVTRYAHLSESLVSLGDTVNKGDLIARMGATGLVTGPHLHFEVIRNGTCVNPMEYVG